jgi:hypothetical protein
MAEPVHIRWVDEPPPISDRAPTLRHQRIAAALKYYPGRWALLPDLPISWASAINKGQNTAYRPSGSFEAVGRQGCLYVRYVGVPS